jgi:hypothetical protein
MSNALVLLYFISLSLFFLTSYLVIFFSLSRTDFPNYRRREEIIIIKKIIKGVGEKLKMEK